MICTQAEIGVPLLVPGLNRALYHWNGIKLEVFMLQISVDMHALAIAEA